MQETNNEQNREPKKHRFRGLKRVLITLAVLWIASELLLRFLATPMLRTSIQDFVIKESDSLYSTDFERLSITMSNTGLELKNFKLIPDKKRYRELKKKDSISTALYRINLDGLYFKRAHLWKLFSKGILEFNALEINGLSLSILGLPENAKTKNSKYDAVHQDIYPIIKPYLTALKVRDLKLTDGYFDMRVNNTDREQSSRADKISVRLKNFSLDSVSYYKRNKLFYSDSLRFIVKNYDMLLNDRMHRVYAQEVRISAADSVIKLIGGGLYPTAFDSEKTPENKPLYFISFPEIKLSGADIYKAWFNKAITVDKVLAEGALIKVISPKRKKRQSNVSSYDVSDFRNLYALIEGRVSEINIKEFDFSGATFEMFRHFKQKKPSFNINEFNLKLNRFLIDSLSVNRNNKFLYADDIDMDVKKYRMMIADGTHTLQTDSFKLSTRQKSIKAFNLKIKPSEKAKTFKLWMDIEVPEAGIYGADFIKAYNNGYLPAESLKALNPKINIKQFYRAVRKGKNTKKKIDFVYNIISDYLQALQIDKIRLENGDLAFEQKTSKNKFAFFKGKLSMDLTNFVIDKNTATRSDRLFYAAGFDIRLKDYAMKSGQDMHILEIGLLNISSSRSLIEIRKLAYYPKISQSIGDMMKIYGKNTLVNFYVDEVILDEIDVRETVFRKNLIINKMQIKQPKLFLQKYAEVIEKDSSAVQPINRFFPVRKTEHEKQEADSIYSSDSYKTVIAGMLSGVINRIDLNKLQIDSGYFHITNYDSLGIMQNYFGSHYSAKVNRFFFNKDSIVNGQPIIEAGTHFKLTRLKVLMPDRFHSLKAGQVNYSNADSVIRIADLRMIPGKQTDSLRPARSLFIPQIKLTGLNTDAVLTERKIQSDSLIATNARIILERPAHLPARNRLKELKLPKNFSDISFKHIELNKGKIVLNALHKDTTTLKLKADFMITAQNCYGDKSKAFPLSADNSELIFTDLSFNFRDSIYSLKSDSIYYTPRNKFILAENLSIDYNPFEILQAGEKRNTGIRVLIPKVRAAGVNIDAYILRNSLEIEHINITSSQIFADKLRPSAKPFRIRDFENKTSRKLTRNLDNIKVDKLEFFDTDFTYTNYSKDSLNIIKINELSGRLRKFNTDTSLISDKRMFLADDIFLIKRNFRTYNKDSSNLITVREAVVSTKQKMAAVKNMSMQPVLNRYDFYQQNPYRKSMVYLDNVDIKLENTDIPKLIEQKALAADNAIISNLDLYIFNNSRKKEDLTDTLKQPPWQKIHNFKMPLTVKTAEIKNGRLRYEQSSNKSTKNGELSVSRISGRAENISNEPKVLQKNKVLRLIVSGYLQNKAFVKTSFRLPLDSTLDNYYFAGIADTFDLRIFNPLIENTVLFSVEKGRADKLSFFVHVDNNIARGDMHFFYSDFQIVRLDSTAKVQGLTSALANTALRNDNPKNRLGQIKEGEIYFKNPKHKSQISLWSNALITGAVSSVVSFKTKEMRKQGRMRRKLEKVLKKEQRKKTRQMDNEKELLNQDLNNKLEVD